jgi:transposase-like protein
MLGSMPWPIRDLLTMKQELVEFALRPGVNRRALFPRYGIRPPCAYKWLKRYQSEGLEGLAEHSRRPHHHPAQIGSEVALRVLEVRDQYPAWGGAQDLSLSTPEGF